MPPLRALPARLLPPSQWGAHHSLVHRGAATQGLTPTQTAAHTPRLRPVPWSLLVAQRRKTPWRAGGPVPAKVRGTSGCRGLPTLAPGFTLRVLPEGRGGGPRAPYDRPKSNQMGWGPRGAGGPFVTVICPAAEITNTFLSEGLAATGLRALMPPSCGHTGRGVGLGEGTGRGRAGQQAVA